jgi:hypothetical protein
MDADETWSQRQHQEAMARGEPGYLDHRSGLYVQTAQSLLNQGECCGQECRHCPWPPEEQQRAGRRGS